MRYLTKNIQNSDPKIIIDTSTFFSALYNPEGNEAKLLEIAGKGGCVIYIIDYVLNELKSVFKRKKIDFNLVLDLLVTYDNIYLEELENLTEEEIELAKQIVDDEKDRPIFLYAYRKISEDDNYYFVTGDKGFFTKEIMEKLNNNLLRTSDALKMIL